MVLLYALVVYLLFLASFSYAIFFIGNMVVPRTLDGMALADPIPSLLVDLLLLGLFAVQHSLMARKSFKAWWTRFVPPSMERATYVLFASAFLFLLCWFWHPIEGEVWDTTGTPVGVVLLAIFWAGWVVLLTATFLINHFELFGLSQAYANLMGRTLPEPEFRTPFLYKHVRHPVYLGFLMAFWAAPLMTWGHLLFAVGATGYILVGIWFEERDLIAHFGARYRAYRELVPALLPRLTEKGDSGPAQQG